jgi:hypothetical protein
LFLFLLFKFVFPKFLAPTARFTGRASAASFSGAGSAGGRLRGGLCRGATPGQALQGGVDGGLCRGASDGGLCRAAASELLRGVGRACREKGERRRGKRERKGEVTVAGEESSPRTAASFSGAGMGSLPAWFRSAHKFP